MFTTQPLSCLAPVHSWPCLVRLGSPHARGRKGGGEGRVQVGGTAQFLEGPACCVTPRHPPPMPPHLLRGLPAQDVPWAAVSCCTGAGGVLEGAAVPC